MSRNADVKLTREELEKLALSRVSASYYYDLADMVQEVPDNELWDIVNGTIGQDD